MTFRRFIFWLHLGVGLSVGLVVGFLAITGSILAFQPQITAWAEMDVRIAHPAAASSCVAPSALLTSATGLQHRVPSSMMIFSDPHRPTEVTFGRDAVLLLDPCSGALLSDRAGRVRGFFADVRDLHRWIAWKGVRHESLRSIKNAMTLAFLFLLVSGAFLWVPRKMSWKHFRPAMVFRRRLKGRARDWSLHNIFGFWMFVPLTLIVATGVVMAYPWANALLFRAAGSPAPAARGEGEGRQAKPFDPAKYASLDASIKQAMAQDSRWASLVMRMPSQKDAAIAFTIDEGVGGHPQQRAQLSINRKDASVARWEPFAANSRGRKWRLYARFLHTGEVFGFVGQLVAFVAMVSVLVLVWTGFALSLRRWSSWKTRKAAAMEKRKPQEVSA